MSRSIVLLVSALVAGCASMEPPPQPSPFTDHTYADVKQNMPALEAGAGRIVFFRNPMFLLDANTPNILLNGQKIGEAVGGKFFFLDRPAGNYKVSATSDPDGISFALLPGEVKYVRSFTTPGVFGGKMNYLLIDAVDAEPDLEKLVFAQYYVPKPKTPTGPTP